MASAVSTSGLATAEAPAARPYYGGWGVDLSAMDTAVRPGDDFFGYAVGSWVRNTVIPPNEIALSTDYEAQQRNGVLIRRIVEESAAAPATDDARRIGDYYAAYMDVARIERLDAAPVQRDLQAIRSADREGLARIMGSPIATLGPGFFRAAVAPDSADTTRSILQISQSGLGLGPNRDLYLEDANAGLRTAYRDYISRTLAMVGWEEPEAAAQAVLALETRIAQASWSLTDSRDATRTFNPMSVPELERLAPGFPWRSYLEGVGVTPGRLNVAQPSAFRAIAAIYAETPLETLRARQAFHLLDVSSEFLSRRFASNEFAFRSRIQLGRETEQPRAQTAVDLVGASLAQPVGREYVRRYFPPASRRQAERIAAGVVAAMERRIRAVSWMSEATRREALGKLRRLVVLVGYPDHWRDYTGLRIDRADAYGNNQRVRAFEWSYRLSQLTRPIDRRDWLLTPQAVNAYSDVSRVAITIPAGLLQPPYFDPRADPAVNYGALGSVIGHELTHQFDDQGRRRDASGALRDWWTAEDAARFDAQAARLVAQYEGFEALPGLHVNGRLTLGENMADLGGLLLALDAYRASPEGRAARIVGGFTGVQRVFLGHAQAYRGNGREAYLRQEALTNVHAPKPFRVNGVVRNVDAWYEAFGVRAGDRLYLPPAERVRIW